MYEQTNIWELLKLIPEESQMVAQETQLTFDLLETTREERIRTVTSAVEQNGSSYASSGAEAKKFSDDVGTLRNGGHRPDGEIDHHISGDRNRQAGLNARDDSLVKSDERTASQIKILTSLLMFNRETVRLRRCFRDLRKHGFTLRSR